MNLLRSLRYVLISGLLALGVAGQDLPLGPIPDSPHPPRLAVLGISVSTNEPAANPKEALEELIGTAFVQTRRFDLLERPQVDQVIRELRFQREGLVDPASIQELGRMLGAEQAVLGHAQVLVGLRAFEIQLTLRIVQVRTGRIPEAIRVSGKGGSFNLERAMAKALEDLGEELDKALARRYPTRGLVLKALPDGRAWVDLGARDRLVRGDKLQAFRQERILHPFTHTTVEDLSVPLCRLIVDEVHERTALVRTKPRTALIPGTPVERLP